MKRFWVLCFALFFAVIFANCGSLEIGSGSGGNGGNGGGDGVPPRLVAVETSPGGIVDFKFNEDMGPGYGITCPNHKMVGWVNSRTFRITVSTPPGQQSWYVLNPVGYTPGFRDLSREPLQETKGTFIVK